MSASKKTFHQAGELARANRQLARSVLAGLALLAAVAIIGPLISYRSDVAEIRAEFQARVAREAAVYAEALGLHFELLQAELERLAARPEINLLDHQDASERALMETSHGHSALFRGGVAVLDFTGQLVWSEPKDFLGHNRAHLSRWFQEVLARKAPVVDVLGMTSGKFLVAVPVLRSGKTTGVLVGLLDASGEALPGGQPVGPHRILLVLNRAGEVLLPVPSASWKVSEGLGETFNRLLQSSEGARIELGGSPFFAAATPVRATGLRLVLLANEAAVLAPAHARFFAQLVFIAVLQVLTLLLFSLYLGRSYRRFLAMEAHATEQEKMVALGTAASLIAHEVKNSLNGLNAAAALLSAGHEPALSAKTIRGQTERLRHLANSLLHFGKPAATQRVSVQLEELTREAVEGLRVLPEASEVSLSTLSGEPVHLCVDPLLLCTAVDNLVRNAIEASVGAKDLGKVLSPRVKVTTGREGSCAFVRVEDNAGGPPSGFERALFEPFVTSKPKGIGLGLAMANRAVEQQGGTLLFERTAEGSTFTIRLPLEAQ